jgi:hypothetical protein
MVRISRSWSHLDHGVPGDDYVQHETGCKGGCFGVDLIGGNLEQRFARLDTLPGPDENPSTPGQRWWVRSSGNVILSTWERAVCRDLR